MASLKFLPLDPEGRPVAFDTWHDDLQLYLLSDSKDSVSLFDHVSGAAPAPPATADVSTRSQWLSRSQVSASGQVAASCSCRLLSHQTLLWHHRLGHLSLPRLRGMHSHLLCADLHSSSFPPTSAPLQTLHMDVWGPARVSGQGRERYFLLVVDDYTRYTKVFLLRSKGEVSVVLIPWIRTVRLQLSERFGQDLRVLRLHSDRGGEFSSDLLRDFCRGEGITESFTLPESPQQNGIAERRIGLVMEVPSQPLAPCLLAGDLAHTALDGEGWRCVSVSDLSFESATASALVAELLDFATACRLDYASALVAESVPASPPSVGGECALGTDVLEDRQEDFECLAAAVPPMDAEVASWKSTGTYVDEVPPPGANIVDGMWIFRYTFLQGSLHEEIRLRRPPGFTGTFPAGTQWSLRWLVYSLCQAPREWHDTLRTTLAALGFAPSTADPSLFLCTDISLPSFYVLVYVLQRFGFQYSSPQLTQSTSHSLSAPPSDESVEPSGPYPELGYTFILGSGSVSWRSTRSSSVLSSSCEAEIYAGAMAAQELRWLTYLLTDLGEQPRSPPVLYVDNRAMIALCQEHKLEHRTKHIALRYFLARELQQRGQLRLAYVATRANTADVFTKALPPGDHQRFVTVLCLLSLLFFFS
ncbi:unnamed protein product [Closterium sp. NIES-53]